MSLLSELALLFDWPFRGRQKKALTKRQNYDENDFVNHYLNFHFDKNVVIEVWSALQNESAIDNFKPQPDDNLLYIFGLAEDDLDEFILRLLQRCDCKVPKPQETIVMQPINTVSDLIGFIHNMKIHK